MKPPAFHEQLLALLGQGLKIEWAHKERWLAPVLFAATILLTMQFAFGGGGSGDPRALFIAETFVTAFLALQLTFARSLEPETGDRVFTVLRTYPLSRSAWFFAKYLLVMLGGLVVLAPTLLLSLLFHEENLPTAPPALFYGIAVLGVAGLAALGVLLSAMTLSAGNRQLLYPILYFPLSVPVLLTCVEMSRELLTKGQLTDGASNSWLALLIIFDILYLALGFLLFGELVDAD